MKIVATRLCKVLNKKEREKLLCHVNGIDDIKLTDTVNVSAHFKTFV